MFQRYFKVFLKLKMFLRDFEEKKRKIERKKRKVEDKIEVPHVRV